MAHFAQINSENIITNVVVIDDSQENRGQDFLAIDMNLCGTWIQTSYNTRGGIHILGGTPFRKNYAGIGYTYDSKRDAFIPPKPYPSWVLDEDTCLWNAPVVYPTDGKKYTWNETVVNWVLSS